MDQAAQIGREGGAHRVQEGPGTSLPPSGAAPEADLLVELGELVPQRWQSRNIWRQFLWDVTRITVLIASDLSLYFLVRAAYWTVHEGGLGATLADLVSGAFPVGFLGGARFTGALILSLAIAGSYGPGDARRSSSRLLAGASLAAVISLYAAPWGVGVLPTLMRGAAVTAVFALGLTASRSLVDAVVWRVRRRVGGSRTLVLTHSDADWRDLGELLRRLRDFAVVGHVSLGQPAGTAVRERLLRLAHDIADCQAETVLLWGKVTEEEVAHIVDVALSTGCRLLAGERISLGGVKPCGVWMGGRQLLELTPPALRGWQPVLKRGMDLIGAGLGLVLMGPLMLMIALAVRLESGGPVLFAQCRVGARGRLFRCYKFRSMRCDAEQVLRADPELYLRYVSNHFKLPEHEDPRLTRVGRWLRKTSLDELPQLVNVIRGEMSLVGPRPIVPAELDHYGLGNAPVLLALRPGMTGAWAVHGRSEVGYPDRATMELEYIRRWSVLNDLAILVRTVPAVLGARGAH